MPDSLARNLLYTMCVYVGDFVYVDGFKQNSIVLLSLTIILNFRVSLL
jgi:hypothetical protein